MGNPMGHWDTMGTQWDMEDPNGTWRPQWDMEDPNGTWRTPMGRGDVPMQSLLQLAALLAGVAMMAAIAQWE